MKSLIGIVILLIALCGCYSNQPPPQKDFTDCFQQVDTAQEMSTDGCSAGYFKVISDQYVVRIAPTFTIQKDTCLEFTLSDTTQKIEIELWIFERNEANLTNICSDIFIVGMPEHQKALPASAGNIILGGSDIVDYYGNKMPLVSILVKELVFVDPETDERIEVQNELLWKIMNRGTPG